jgi:hypothetical protein
VWVIHLTGEFVLTTCHRSLASVRLPTGQLGDFGFLDYRRFKSQKCLTSYPRYASWNEVGLQMTSGKRSQREQDQEFLFYFIHTPSTRYRDPVTGYREDEVCTHDENMIACSIESTYYVEVTASA